MKGLINIKDRKIRLLSLDGGGIRGVLSGQIIVRIENLLKEITNDPTTRIGDYFDIISGTSTGAILACAYITPNEYNKPKYSAEEVVSFYLDNGDKIFNKSFKQRIKSGFGIFSSEFDEKGLVDSLEKYFGDLELKDLLKPCLIPSVETEKRECILFKQHNAKLSPDENFYVKDVLRGTTSAPTYFKPAEIYSISGNRYSLVDGGLYANNSSLCAYTEINKIFESKRNLTVRDVKILSIGTGSYNIAYENKKARKWGLLQWAKPSIDMMMSSTSNVTHYQLNKLFDSFNCSEQYLRINPILPQSLSSMDNTEKNNMKNLQEKGDNIFEINKDKLKAFLEL